MSIHITHHTYNIVPTKKQFEKVFYLGNSPVQPLIMPMRYCATQRKERYMMYLCALVKQVIMMKRAMMMKIMMMIKIVMLMMTEMVMETMRLGSRLQLLLLSSVATIEVHN